MFNLFKKKQIALIQHRYKNLLILLPANWEYELEAGDLEACFDPKSQSTLRLHIMELIPPKGIPSDENMGFLIGDQLYVTTPKGYLLTNPTYREFTEGGKNITLLTWRLINNIGDEKILAVITYTVLSEEKDSTQEKEIINLIENSLQESELL